MFVIYWFICLVAVGIDRIFGDPSKWHPVIWIGKGIQFLELKWNKGNYRYFKGGVTVLIIVGIVTILTYSIMQFLQFINIWLWVVGEIILINLAIAQKSLQKAAMLVYRGLEDNDINDAREKLGWIVGRNTAHLDESEIVRGVIETVSENTSDGVTAPLFYALCFGATGAWCYKAINTLDSMIAYKNERYKQFGYAAAKLDDLANYIPSRLTGLLIIIGTKATQKQTILFRIRNWLVDAKKHPSPNSGYLEAATAWQLGIRLGGVNYYGNQASFRAYMGEPLVQMQRHHILQSIVHMYRCVGYFIILGGIIYAISYTWS